MNSSSGKPGRPIFSGGWPILPGKSIKSPLKVHFRPEFINRLDDIVEFDTLTREQIGEIVGMQVQRVIDRIAQRGIAVELMAEARELLGDLGYDPVYGARPLKRVIQKRLVDRLALSMLQGEFGERDTIRVDAADGELVLIKAQATPGAAAA